MVLGGVGLLAAHFRGVCFHHLTVITCPKAYRVWWRRRVWALVPSESSNEMNKKEAVSDRYVLGSQTHEGFWIMVRAAYVVFLAIRVLWALSGV